MSNSQVVATVGGREITRLDVELLLRSMDPQKAAQFKSPEGINRVIEELVNQELFYLYAKENNIEEEEQYKLELEKIISTFLKQYTISKVVGQATVAGSEIEAFYNENKEKFVNPESVEASHILVEDEDKALEILKEINDGLSFEEAATQYSSCPSSAQGGNLGVFGRGRMVPEFEEAAFNMEKNAVSAPVQTQFGFHLIKVVEKNEKTERPLEEVKNQIRQHLVAEKQQTIYYDTVESLKEKYSVKIFE
ncbi:peptidylprolyl isomerase [Serpentinicella alkaliphila]|uniref:Peptidyl-prolyl cis-trans isomerase C n=1 Tax=Serpentinicella alkaliphila TaxID=1734049 RepID=A0A4R2TP76_9FIRM|nr:peptidylprolyl isomerase [Serpentinicella alkaliphila]QUH24647.1 peptidylprolyl isomerase [Serpentinicella alkaliphila]TCQ03095.1 peptidyl-prolyl cis-trans isomerase C [Serpentinicella alkaliphila]